MKGEVKLDLFELDRLRDIEKNFNEKVKEEEKRITKQEDELKKMIKNLKEGGTVYIEPTINSFNYLHYKSSDDIVTTDKAVEIVIKEVEELKLEVKELKKRPTRCILF